MGEVFFVMMVPITAILTTGTVMLLRPISKELGGLLQAMTQERKLRAAPAPATPDMTQVRDLLSTIDSRLSLMEERQDFAEALLSGGERRVIAAAPARAAGQN